MTRDDIIRLAREAGFAEDMAENWLGEMLVWEAEPKNLERFAALVAAAEREACAKVCDPYTHGQWFAAAIRKRGKVT